MISLQSKPLFNITASQHIKNASVMVQWCWEQLDSYYGSNSFWISHADILFIANGVEQIKMKEISNINEFLKSSASQLNQKYIIIENVIGLTVQAQNKLLKFFEEPPVPATFLLLNPSRIKLLPTVTSRAQQLKINVNIANEQLINPTEILAMNFSEFQDKFKSNWDLLEQLYQSMCHHLPHKAKAAQELSDIYQIYSQDRVYHNSTNYLCYKMFRFAQRWAISSQD